MYILQLLEIIRKKKKKSYFDFYYFAYSSCFTPNKNGTENKVAGIGRRENADQPVEQPGDVKTAVSLGNNK